MERLLFNRALDERLQVLTDTARTSTGIAISKDLTHIQNLRLDTLSTSTGYIPTEGSLYFKGNDGLRFELKDSFTEFSGAFTNAGDKAITMSRFASAVTQFFIYEPIASPTDYFNITTLTNGATSISTLDIAGADAYMTISPDGYLVLTCADYLSITPKGGGTGGADLRLNYDTNDYTRIDIDATGDITFKTYDEGSQVQTGTAVWDGYSTFEINSTSGVSLKLAKDSNDYATFGVADTGDLTITTVGDGSTDSDFTLDIDGDIELNADGGTVTIKDGSATHFLFGCDSTRFRIYDDTNEADFFTITVGDEGATSISTTDADTAVGHLTLVPDGDLILDPASTKVIINATDDLFFDGGGDTYITESTADNLQFVVGGDQILNMAENGTSGNHAHFKTASAGFTTIAETFSDDSIIGSGGTHDTHIDFRHTNKISLAVTADITNLNLIFPMSSGNFLLLLTYDGDHDITNYKVYEYDESSADGDADVLWAGGSAPATTPTGVDIFSFYWDALSEKCYGVGSLNFGN